MKYEQRLWSLACSVGLLLFSACGPSTSSSSNDAATSPGPLVGLVSIDVSPPTATLTTTNGAVSQQAYTALGHYQDGHSADVTAHVTWSLADADLGTFAGAMFSANPQRGGKTVVKATTDSVTGTAQLIVQFVATRVATEDGSTAPGNAGTLFAGAATQDATLAPTIAYPSDTVTMPVNLGELEVQWKKPARAADLFEVAFLGTGLDLRIYTNAMAAAGGRVHVLPSEWDAISRTVAGGTLSIKVTGMITADPTKSGSATAVGVKIDPNTLSGGIYYWSPTNQGILRHAFGDTTGVADNFYSVANSGGHCVACHVLSRDGKKAAVTFDGGAAGGSALLDVGSVMQTIPQTQGLLFDFASFSPDANKLVAAHLTKALTVYDTSGGPNQGMVLNTIDDGGQNARATHPDWSPDGKSLVFVRIDNATEDNAPNDWDFRGGSLVIATGPGDGTFTNPKVLVASTGTDNNYYPSFSPDGKWILFNHASGGSAYNNQDAQVYVVATDGSVGPIALTKANGTGPLTNSWPRWAPFVQTYVDGSTRMYFTFSSKRDYGIEMVQPVKISDQRPQIWMAAFDPAAATAKTDASSVAFWLPFQDLMTSNHIAQWTQAIIQ